MTEREHKVARGMSTVAKESIEALYTKALPAKRTGALYGAFPYPTKISPEAIALYIAAHTQPGDTVFDGFAGSGTTGLAALLCENPSAELRDEAKRLGLKVKWGARNAVLYELSALGSFIGRTLTNPPDPDQFLTAVNELLDSAVSEDGWMYRAVDPDGNVGTVRYLIWSDCLVCPSCKRKVSLWDASVSRAPATIASRFTCPECGHEASFDGVHRTLESTKDDVLGTQRKLRARQAVWMYGTTGKKNWSRPVTPEDLKLIRRIEREPVPESVPRVAIPWGDLYRRGYHQGISHLHHFYTRRNLIVFARLWERSAEYDAALRDALRFWLLSYNASHATIMTRVVAKSGQSDLVVTSAQPGVLYVSGLPVEKNLFAGLQRKATTISNAFRTVHGRQGHVDVYQASSCNVHLADRSIDYVFTDPPFGGNIPYAEVNFINEAWLGQYTDRTEEAIISSSQSKSLADYKSMLTSALKEANRILKQDGAATVVFHSASAAVWRALQGAYQDAGFSVDCAGILDKTQGSFKQVTTAGAVRGDPVMLLRKQKAAAYDTPESVWIVANRLQTSALLAPNPVEATAQRLYSRLVAHYLAHNQEVPLDADAFYQWHATQPDAPLQNNVGE